MEFDFEPLVSAREYFDGLGQRNMVGKFQRWLEGRLIPTGKWRIHFHQNSAGQ